jgi:hypothetical protein
LAKNEKNYLCVLTAAIMFTSIIGGGCTTSNKSSQASTSEASAEASASSTVIEATTTPSATITPSPTASPTVTPSPPASGKIATSIEFARVPTAAKGGYLYINVISSASGCRICSPGTVTVSEVGGQMIETVSYGGCNCFYTAYLNASSLNPGTYDVILKFAGDSCYEASQNMSKR